MKTIVLVSLLAAIASAAAAQNTNANRAYVGNTIGSDPDPLVRLELLRAAQWQKGG